MNAPANRPYRMLRIAEVAERLSVSERTVRRWIRSGELVAHCLGRSLRVSEGDLRVFLAARRLDNSSTFS